MSNSGDFESQKHESETINRKPKTCRGQYQPQLFIFPGPRIYLVHLVVMGKIQKAIYQLDNTSFFFSYAVHNHRSVLVIMAGDYDANFSNDRSK